jgi:beta-phosphoglucomutase
MKQLHVKAVLFDMDGVIANTMPYHFRAWKKVFKDAGLEVTSREVFLREGQPGRLTVKELFTERGIPFSKEIADTILNKKEALFKKIVKRRFISGSRGYLNHLQKKGVRLALVTGTSRHETHRILPKKIFNMFDVVVTGNDVKHGKPHPEPYLLALKKLQCKPDEAFVIENAPFGIRSAKKADLVCIALETSLPKGYLKEADYIFASFRELKARIALA